MGPYLLAQQALRQTPRLLTLLDRNPHSPTYGCFDRNHWHYRIIDFPSGMSQEFVWPLALAHEANVPGNDLFGAPVVRDWVAAGIRFAARSAHRDGSCDDYFPYERAAGAAAFSLLACIESHELLGLDLPEARELFRRRADWLAQHREAGALSNHEALIALCLQRAGEVLRTDRWTRTCEHRLQRVLGWQDEEGWFREYEGCDPGYHTLTLWCLARLHQRRPDDSSLRNALERGVELAWQCMHPDGSFGGEYASRNTYNYFPAAFELIGRWMPAALSLNDLFLDGLRAGVRACCDDDHIVGHHLWNDLLAWRHWIEPRPPTRPRPTTRTWLPNAGLLIDRRGGQELYVAANKGGVFKLFANGQLVASDTHWSVQIQARSRRLRNAVAHLIDRYELVIEDDTITVRGSLGWSKQQRMTPMKLVLLRLVMLGGGRHFANVIRRVLQRMLITGKTTAPLRFERTLQWTGQHWSVRDRLWARSWRRVAQLGIGCDQTSIYVVMSRVFQRGQLQGWRDLGAHLADARADEPVDVRRALVAARSPVDRPATESVA